MAEVPSLEARYAEPASRKKTVIICGGSSSKPGVVAYEPFTAKLADRVIRAGGNIVTGAGEHGPMGSAFRAGAAAALAPNTGENLSVMRDPGWGDENFKDARAVGKAPSDELRFDKFEQLGATVVIAPGGVGALLEGVKALYSVAYPNPSLPPFDDILVVGDYYRHLKGMVDEMVSAGTLSTAAAAKVRFVPADDRIIDEIVAKVSRAAAPV